MPNAQISLFFPIHLFVNLGFLIPPHKSIQNHENPVIQFQISLKISISILKHNQAHYGGYSTMVGTIMGKLRYGTRKHMQLAVGWKSLGCFGLQGKDCKKS